MPKKQKPKEISELGEFGLIEHLTKKIKLKNPSTIKGIGDDAAVVKHSGQTIITTDMLVENVHFNLMYTPLKHLGYKSAVVNFSDCYAMNARPEQLTVSMAISNKYCVEDLEDLYEGILLACKIYGVDLVGGDTTTSPGGLVLSLTVLGDLGKNQPVYRSGAKDNDLICVSGDLGAAYIGLQLLEREKEVFKVNPHSQPDFTGLDHLLEKQLKPEARKDVIEFFAQTGIVPTSMIDVSDGLSSEVLHICKNSGVGCSIYEEKIPVADVTARMAREMNLDPTTCALNGGEDYELLFTLPQKDFDKINDIDGISIIGHINPKETGCMLVARDGTLVPLVAQGWNHFGS
ncbi:MAG: thiamine-phosphate kinase [Bacteroidetes bacterium GWF2_38_335]|nr:MAG: thiamine-phosphate kinase [Bacteroidetes bacterium GWF2_38_335]OFY77950.1 MAG: thiamine-phosphate kinase [Bacteroidetes bacterium RIFOXYA12_FULL_38_20]HBS86691.1 thiamine-phosphate kinase [Bacteroidales bacterium]